MILRNIKKECDGKSIYIEEKTKKTYKSQEVLSLVVEKEEKNHPDIFQYQGSRHLRIDGHMPVGLRSSDCQQSNRKQVVQGTYRSVGRGIDPGGRWTAYN